MCSYLVSYLVSELVPHGIILESSRPTCWGSGDGGCKAWQLYDYREGALLYWFALIYTAWFTHGGSHRICVYIYIYVYIIYIYT